MQLERRTPSPSSSARSSGTEIDLADAPDLFPIVAVMATQAKGSHRHHQRRARPAQGERPHRRHRQVPEGHGGGDRGEEGRLRRSEGPCQLKGAAVDSAGRPPHTHGRGGRGAGGGRRDHHLAMAIASRSPTRVSLDDMRSLGADMEVSA